MGANIINLKSVNAAKEKVDSFYIMPSQEVSFLMQLEKIVSSISVENNGGQECVISICSLLFIPLHLFPFCCWLGRGGVWKGYTDEMDVFFICAYAKLTTIYWMS